MNCASQDDLLCYHYDVEYLGLPVLDDAEQSLHPVHVHIVVPVPKNLRRQLSPYPFEFSM